MDDSTARYIGQLKRIPRLTAEEEKRLFKKIKEERDEDAIKKIAKNYLMLIVKIALGYSKRYPNIILEASDLIHEGYMGVLRAARNFDYEYKDSDCPKFSTYAGYWIRQGIILSLYNHSKTIKNYYLITWQVNLFYRIRNEAAQLGKEVSLEEIAEKMGIPAEKLQENIMLIYKTRTVSISAPIKSNSDKRNAGVIEDFVPDKKIPNPEEIFQMRQMKEKARKMLLTCSPREEKVLRMRFGIGEKKNHTLGETGDMFSMTRERIRQIEKKALRKLRKKFAIKGNSKSFDFKNYL